MIILNKYKNILDDLIDSSDIEFPDQPKFPDWPGPIDKKIRIAPRSKDASSSLLEENHLGENVSITALEQAPKIRDS